jgi:hypothetical protein
MYNASDKQSKTKEEEEEEEEEKEWVQPTTFPKQGMGLLPLQHTMLPNKERTGEGGGKWGKGQANRKKLLGCVCFSSKKNKQTNKQILQGVKKKLCTESLSL